MSKIIFITSEKPLELEEYDIKEVKPNYYTYTYYPCLKGKKNIYDLENFNNNISYKQLINELINNVEKDNNIVFLILEQTENEKEINELNKNIKNNVVIKLGKNDNEIFDLVYRLERNSLITSSEYSFIID